MVVVPEIPGMLEVEVAIGFSGPGWAHLLEGVGEPRVGVAVASWLADAAVEVDHCGDAFSGGGLGGGDGWVPRQNVF